MSEQAHRIELTGEFAPGADWNASLESLAALMKLPLPKARTLLENAPVAIKRDVDAKTAELYKARIEQTGVLCRIVPPVGEPVPAAPPATTADPLAPASPTDPLSPGQGPEHAKTVMLAMAEQADLPDPEPAPQAKNDATTEDNAVQPHDSTLSEFLRREEDTQGEVADPHDTTWPGLRDDLDGRGAPAGADSIEVDKSFFGRGFGWVAEGFSLFAKSPWVWMGITLVYGVAVLAINIVPIIGYFAYYLLQPVLVGGVMLGCHALERGEKLEISHLFQGFDTHLDKLIKLGCIYLGGTLAAIAGTFIVIIAIAGPAAILDGGWDGGGSSDAFDLTLIIGALIAIAVGMTIGFVTLAMLWFSPALIVFRDAGVMESAKLSLRGVMRNFLPFLLYGVVLALGLIIASLPLGLGLLVFGPVMMASVYISYREIYPDFSDT